MIYRKKPLNKYDKLNLYEKKVKIYLHDRLLDFFDTLNLKKKHTHKHKTKCTFTLLLKPIPRARIYNI